MRARPLALALGLLALPACSPGRLDAIDLAPNSLGSGMLAHYRFDESGGSAVKDYSPSHHDGVVTGATAGTWIAGKFAGAIHFDGNSYVSVDTFPDAPPSFSAAVWIRTTNTPVDAGLQTIVSTEIGLDAGWEINVDKVVTGALLHAAYWDPVEAGYTIGDCECIPDATWTHFAFVVDDATHTLTIYVNGQHEKTVPAPRPIIPGTPALSIGHWLLPGRLLVGDLDDLVIYDRALAPQEVAALFRRPPEP